MALNVSAWSIRRPLPAVVFSIILLFLGETSSLRLGSWAVAGFLLGIVCFLLALLCFLAETLLATQVLNFRLPPARSGP